MAEDAAQLYRLVPRPLTEADRVWLGLFTAGDQYWACEVTDFLRDDALIQWQAGYSTTTLYSPPETPGLIVGFISASVAHWGTKKTRKAFPEWDHAIEKLPERVPVMLILFLGVAENHQGQGYGSEIMVRFLEEIANFPGVPRFIYLQVWEDNADAIRFYEGFGFSQFAIEGRAKRPYGDDPANLVFMAYDRFRLPTSDRLAN